MDKEALQQSFALRIRTLRAEKGLSQEILSNRIGMDRSYYASIETGMRNVTLVNIAKIADGLEVTLSTLMKGVTF